jgi:hypothetical protein
MEFYKVLSALYNINQPRMIHQTREKQPTLWTLYGLTELQTLCNYDRPCIIYQTCGLYKVWWSLYNIRQGCMIYQTCEILPDLLAL